MKNKNFKRLIGRTKRATIAVLWSEKRIDVALLNGGENRYESFLPHETAADVLKSKIKDLKRGYRCQSTFLVIPRLEVIQKQIMLQAPEKLDMLTPLSRFLPYAADPMAYDITERLLYAIPEKKICGILEALDRVDFHPDEILCEDQVLLWACHDQFGETPALILDRNLERLLLIAVQHETILFSRSVALPHTESPWTGLPEPAMVLLSGEWSEDDRRQIEKRFDVPLVCVEPVRAGSHWIPAVLSGVCQRGQAKPVSLLPEKLKMLRENHRESILRRQSLTSILAFMAACLLASCLHHMLLESRETHLQRQAYAIAPQVRSIQTMHEQLKAVENTQQSKIRLLELTAYLAQHLPSSVRLRELSGSSETIRFQGDSPSQALLADVMQRLDQADILKSVKLEHTRNRKKFNESYFEFEISALWKK